MHKRVLKRFIAPEEVSERYTNSSAPTNFLESSPVFANRGFNLIS